MTSSCYKHMSFEIIDFSKPSVNATTSCKLADDISKNLLALGYLKVIQMPEDTCVDLYIIWTYLISKNPKVGGFKYPWDETFSVPKFRYFLKEIDSWVKNECCYRCTLHNINVEKKSCLLQQIFRFVVIYTFNLRCNNNASWYEIQSSTTLADEHRRWFEFHNYNFRHPLFTKDITVT